MYVGNLGEGWNSSNSNKWTQNQSEVADLDRMLFETSLNI